MTECITGLTVADVAKITKTPYDTCAYWARSRNSGFPDPFARSQYGDTKLYARDEVEAFLQSRGIKVRLAQ